MALSDVHQKVHFQNRNKLFRFNAKLWDIHMLRSLESGRDKTVMSPVTHNNVVYNICCLN